jgi:hypothetical protein
LPGSKHGLVQCVKERKQERKESKETKMKKENKLKKNYGWYTHVKNIVD